MKTPVYLDHNATTPIDPRVLEFLAEVQREHFGNPASQHHALGWAADKLVTTARQQVADLIGATPREIIFTSGATESNNMAIQGTALAFGDTPGHMVSSNIEHEAVSAPMANLQNQGWTISQVSADPNGLVPVVDIEQNLSARTVLVSVIAAQNEIGTLQPIGEIGKICKSHGVWFHCDAAQAAGKIALDVNQQGVDLLSLSSHKIYGPKGVGALYVRRRDPRITLHPIQFGGGQERGLRPGTMNVPSIAAFGEACRLAREEMAVEGQRLLRLRKKLWQSLEQALPGVSINGCPDRRLPGNLNVSFKGVRAHSLLGKLTTLAVSSSSACSSAESQPSAILKNIGLSDELASASLRIGLGRHTTEDEVDFAAQKIISVVKGLRKE